MYKQNKFNFRCGIFNLSSEAGEMNRKIQLGFSLPEAQFCVRQLDLRKNNLSEELKCN
jgi:hypothetical protein